MDDFLWFGDSVMEERMQKIRDLLRIGTEEIDTFMYLGASLVTHFEDPDDTSSAFEVSIGQEAYVDQLTEISLSRDRLRDSDAESTLEEYESFRTGLGQIGWISAIVHFYLQLLSSFLATRVTDLRVRDLAKLNKTVRTATWHESF